MLPTPCSSLDNFDAFARTPWREAPDNSLRMWCVRCSALGGTELSTAELLQADPSACVDGVQLEPWKTTFNVGTERALHALPSASCEVSNLRVGVFGCDAQGTSQAVSQSIPDPRTGGLGASVNEVS